MMVKRSFLGWILAPVLASGAVLSGARAETASLAVMPAKVRQGEALFVRLEEPEAEKAEARWRNGTYPLFHQGNGWTGALPVTPDTRAGGYTVAVSFTRGGRP